MIEISNIEYRAGDKFIFEGASASIADGVRTGVTGRNGSGKSTLFALIAGERTLDGGTIWMPPGTTIAKVEQETPALETPAIEYVIGGDKRLAKVKEELAAAELSGNGDKIAHLHAEVELCDGYTINSRAATLLTGLGFSQDKHQTPVREFSGGWRMRLNLARALVAKSDILLLDEPTNHLDIDAVIFLKEFLLNYRGTLLLVSHDRDFLDSIAQKIVHVEGGHLEQYTGNYTSFERQRAEKANLQEAAREKQEAAMAKMRAFVERFRYKATKAKQAQSRLKALEKMEVIAKVKRDSPFSFSFADPGRVPDPILACDNARLGYGDHTVLDKVKLRLVPGSRIGLLGRNGEGKSTMVKFLAGVLAPLSGECIPSKNARIGYFAQEQLEALRLDESALWHLRREEPDTLEQELRDFLGSFAFRGDRVTDKVCGFSGGEKARLALALIARRKPNLLLLDEPTNHLDIVTRDALAEALQGFDGALVTVSHDRHLLESTCDSFLLISDGRVTEFDGDLADYAEYLAQKRKEQNDGAKTAEQNGALAASSSPAGNQTAGKSLTQKEMRQAQAAFRNKMQPLKKEIEKLDKEMAKLSARNREIEELLADATIYETSRKAELSALLEEKGKIGSELESIEELWCEKSQELEDKTAEFEASLRDQSC